MKRAKKKATRKRLAINTGNRHAAHGDVNLSVRIQVPMTEEFRERVKSLAESRGIKSAELIRRLLDAELDNSGH